MRGGDEHPLAAADVVEKLQSTTCARWVVATGQYSPSPDATTRVFVFEDHGARLRPRVDAWLVTTDLEVLRTSLARRGEVCAANTDAMYATTASHVWGRIGDQLNVWQSGRLLGRFDAQKVALKQSWWKPWHSYRVVDLSCVRAFLGPGWVQRGVILRRPMRGDLVIAKKREISASLDPTYDGIDLMCDAAWVTDLARDVAEATGLPIEIDADLR